MVWGEAMMLMIIGNETMSRETTQNKTVIMKYYRYSYLYVDKISLSLYVNDVVSIVRILIRHD